MMPENTEPDARPIDPVSEETEPGPVATKNDDKPGRWEVRLSHPLERRRRVFSSVSEKRARSFLERRYPRGSEAYLVSPTGEISSFESERVGRKYGEDLDSWGPFNPDDYRPPEEQPPPGDSEWADREG